MLSFLLRFMPMALKLWPVVTEAVRTVEAIKRAESGEVKKAVAKKFIQEKLSSPFPKIAEKDFDAIIGALIDIAVALYNTFGWPKGNR